MPLITTGRTISLVAADPWFVAVPMEVEGSNPPIAVQVRATKESIEALDPMGALGQRPPLDVAQGDRMRIETAASVKFDKNGFDREEPAKIGRTLTLGYHDFP